MKLHHVSSWQPFPSTVKTAEVSVSNNFWSIGTDLLPNITIINNDDGSKYLSMFICASCPANYLCGLFHLSLTTILWVGGFYEPCNFLDQELANVFGKEPESKYLKICQPYSYYTAIQLLVWCRSYSDNTQPNKCNHVPVKVYLQKSGGQAGFCL